MSSTNSVIRRSERYVNNFTWKVSFENFHFFTGSKEDRLYSEWGDWEDCSVTCGGGTHKRVRTCTDPSLGGSVCVEDAKEETKSCNDFECPDSKYYYFIINIELKFLRF